MNRCLTSYRIRGTVFAVVFLLAAGPAQAQEIVANAAGQEIDRYCTNISDAAADARHALQVQELEQLRGDIDTRIARLEEKRKDYETWLKRRDEFIDKAEDSLVDIISKMRPDAAAAQMAMLGDEAAAAILLKLNPRVSSVILNEMAADKSARLARVIVGAHSLPQAGNRPESSLR
ncbi:MAG: MotE family protein [Phyllobacterium sp.]